MVRQKCPLNPAGKEAVFRIATRALVNRYAAQIAAGMTDKELTVALQQVLGIFGGSCGPDRPCVVYQSSGLKIWGGWHIVNHVTEKPLFQGSATLTMARQIYRISNPDDAQMTLF